MTHCNIWRYNRIIARKHFFANQNMESNIIKKQMLL
nr:MAG TPA: hypothetical protein [Caudoviricetes sp.]